MLRLWVILQRLRRITHTLNRRSFGLCVVCCDSPAFTANHSQPFQKVLWALCCLLWFPSVYAESLTTLTEDPLGFVLFVVIPQRLLRITHNLNRRSFGLCVVCCDSPAFTANYSQTYQKVVRALCLVCEWFPSIYDSQTSGFVLSLWMIPQHLRRIINWTEVCEWSTSVYGEPLTAEGESLTTEGSLGFLLWLIPQRLRRITPKLNRRSFWLYAKIVSDFQTFTANHSQT